MAVYKITSRGSLNCIFLSLKQFLLRQVSPTKPSRHLDINCWINRSKAPFRDMENTIFDKFHRFSRILSLYNRERYQLNDRKAWWRQILFAVIFSILIIFVALLLVTAIWHCFDCDFSIMGTAFAVPVSFVILQLFTVCISMIKNNRKLARIVNHLELIVQKREIFFILLVIFCS